MKKIAALMLVLLPLMLPGQQCALAGPLGIAGEYNVFVFGDIEQWGTDVEGRVAAGGNAVFGRPNVLDPAGAIVESNGFAIASTEMNHALNLVAGGNVTLTNGSVGYLEPGNTGSAISQKGDIVHDGVATIGPDVGHGSLQTGTPLDFAAQQGYLESLSGFWGGLTPNGANIGTFGNIDLAGSNPLLNIFSLAATAILQTGIRFDFHVPAGSTVLVNVVGKTATLMNLAFFFNDIAAEFDHAAGYPYSSILFNFPPAMGLDMDLITIDLIAIGGSILAPWAHVEFGKNSHIDGNLIALSLRGEGESHSRLFNGSLPAIVAEPAVPLLLLIGGLACLFARRRRP